MRSIGVVTTCQTDYSIYLPVLRKIEAEAELDLELYVSGRHLSEKYGMTVDEIEKDGFLIASRLKTLSERDTRLGVAESISSSNLKFAELFDEQTPDILLTLGDEYEMYSAVAAARPFDIPVAHIHGGKLNYGAFDDTLRYSITKLSHLHFVAANEYAKRLIQLGEEAWRVHVSGAPEIDNLKGIKLLEPEALKRGYNLSFDKPPLLVTFHPATKYLSQVSKEADELLGALSRFDIPIIFTLPNPDPGGQMLSKKISDFCEEHKKAQLKPSLGIRGYFSLMACSAAMIGNSSSGLIEAPSFKLPVVNIGSRQESRIKARNIIDVLPNRENITEGIRKALSPTFRGTLLNMENPFGNGQAADIIVNQLKTVELDARLLLKKPNDKKED